jgi:translation initiation factor 2 gamma subunit (eIF-2gamma)
MDGPTKVATIAAVFWGIATLVVGAPKRRDHLGFVDVPGHEGLVHNMLAGATGIDFVVLLVAADDGVMPQTREHLAIMDLHRSDVVLLARIGLDVGDLGVAVHGGGAAGRPR